MSEYTLLTIGEEKESLGNIEIARDVIEVVASIAALEVEGVYDLQGSIADDVAERFGRKSYGKGVKVDLTESGAVVTISMLIHYGSSVPVTAKQVQENIQQTVRGMTDIHIDAVNVHIIGLQFPEEEQPLQEQEK